MMPMCLWHWVSWKTSTDSRQHVMPCARSQQGYFNFGHCDPVPKTRHSALKRKNRKWFPIVAVQKPAVKKTFGLEETSPPLFRHGLLFFVPPIGPVTSARVMSFIRLLPLLAGCDRTIPQRLPWGREFTYISKTGQGWGSPSLAWLHATA